MTEDALDPAAYAVEIDVARDRLIGFVDGCSEEQWRAAPLAPDGDPRPVAVVVDHVALAYEYLAGWIRQIAAGEQVDVDSDAVDALNAEHAAQATAVTRAEATAHLRRSGAAISDLVAGLSAADLALANGQTRLLAQIAARHADGHRTELEAALARSGG